MRTWIWHIVVLLGLLLQQDIASATFFRLTFAEDPLESQPVDIIAECNSGQGWNRCGLGSDLFGTAQDVSAEGATVTFPFPSDNGIGRNTPANANITFFLTESPCAAPFTTCQVSDTLNITSPATGAGSLVIKFASDSEGNLGPIPAGTDPSRVVDESTAGEFCTNDAFGIFSCTTFAPLGQLAVVVSSLDVSEPDPLLLFCMAFGGQAFSRWRGKRRAAATLAAPGGCNPNPREPVATPSWL